MSLFHKGADYLGGVVPVALSCVFPCGCMTVRLKFVREFLQYDDVPKYAKIVIQDGRQKYINNKTSFRETVKGSYISFGNFFQQDIQHFSRHFSLMRFLNLNSLVMAAFLSKTV